MKALNFNKNSWHFKLVTKLQLYEAPYERDVWGDGSYIRTCGDSADICTYSKTVVLALFLVSFMITIFFLVSMIMIHALFGIYFSILLERWLFSELGNIGVGLVSLGTGIFMFTMLIEKIKNFQENNRYKVKSSKSDSFVKNAYKSWKNKFCVPINFE